jgi:hypothetical protein
MPSWWINYQYWKQDTIRFEYRIHSAGLLFDVGGVVQLHISGLFDLIMEQYGDEERYPYGPPSHITRRIIDNPGEPVRMWLRTFLFFDTNTGFYLLLAGFAFQLVGTWA